jgi:hypothetical protein
MAPRSRLLAFGSAAVLVLAGSACAAFVGGVTGEVLTIVLISGGLTWAVLLMFLEVGLSEERDLARTEQRRRRRDRRAASLRRRARLPQRPRRPQ